MIYSLSLKNWKIHSDSTLEFDKGTNVILGRMGAGKSSILQALSFALFGTFSELKRRELKITEVVKRGKDTAKIILDFEKSGINYRLERAIEPKGSGDCTLRDGDRLIAGPNPTAVTDYLKDLLKIDEDLFLKTIYARQNELDLFLSLTPGDRKTQIDVLMGLDRFEEARKTSVKLSNKLLTIKATKEQILIDFDLENLNNELAKLENEQVEMISEQKKLDLQLVSARKQKESIDSELADMRYRHEEFTKMRERENLIGKQVDEYKSKLSEKKLIGTKDVLEDRLKTIVSKIEDLKSSRKEYSEDLNKNQEKVLTFERDMGVLDQKFKEISKKLKEIESYKSALKELESEGSSEDALEKLEALNKTIEVKKSEEQQKLGEVKNLKKTLVELEEAKGVCPVCSNVLQEHVKENLVQRRKETILELEKQIETIHDTIPELMERRDSLDNLLSKQKDYLEKVKEYENLIEEERKLIVERSKADGQRTALQQVIETISKRLNDTESELDKLSNEKSELEGMRHFYDLKDELQMLEKERNNLKEMLGGMKSQAEDLAKVEKKFEDAGKNLQILESKKDSFKILIDEKGKRLDDLLKKKQDIVKVEEEVKALEKQVEFIKRFTSALLSAQEVLRKNFVTAVNEVMSSTWQEIYPYDAWNAVRLLATENDYLLQLRQGDEWFPVVGFASGGERVLAALAVRIAFAKLMAPNFSVLILDEPTHNLDVDAIDTLVKVLQERVSNFVDQIFVVTHEERIAEAADVVIRL